MFFRNLTFFRFPVSLDLALLETHLGECALKPAGPMELFSRGFVWRAPGGKMRASLLARARSTSFSARVLGRGLELSEEFGAGKGVWEDAELRCYGSWATSTSERNFSNGTTAP